LGIPKPAPDENIMAIMAVNHVLAQQPPAQAGEEKFLTVNMVMPAAGDTAEGSASFGRLLLTLSALALGRFCAAGEKHSPDAVRVLLTSRLAGVPADPFDGQLLRFRQADTGYRLHSVEPELKDEM
jgi:hypothetical protein